MRERPFPTSTYHDAAIELLHKDGFEITPEPQGKLLAKRSGHSLYMDIVGKQLPYLAGGQPAFPWETWLFEDRLRGIERAAKDFRAEPWLCFCYFIRDTKYEVNFSKLTKRGTNVFGIRLISVDEYKSHMEPRSPGSWDAVVLPRHRVLELTSTAGDKRLFSKYA